MLNYTGVKKNAGYILYVGLTSQADTKLLQVNPTIAAGDFKVSIDGGAFNNLGTLPVVTPAGGRAVKITLASGEVNGDSIVVQCVDAAGAEWCDEMINIQTVPLDASIVQIDGTPNASATFSLKQLSCINNSGDAIVAQSTGGNGHGISTSGNGSGSGISGLAGITGHGILGTGGATSGSGGFFLAVGSGNGVTSSGAANGHGISANGNGSGDGIASSGGNTGHGAAFVGGAASGHGILATAIGGGAGLATVGVGTVSIAATQGISGPFDTATYNAITDNALLRDYTAVSSGGAPSFCTMNAMRSLRHWAVSGSTYTAYAEDATTPVFTLTLTTDAAALAVVKFGVA